MYIGTHIFGLSVCCIFADTADITFVVGGP